MGIEPEPFRRKAWLPNHSARRLLLNTLKSLIYLNHVFILFSMKKKKFRGEVRTRHLECSRPASLPLSQTLLGNPKMDIIYIFNFFPDDKCSQSAIGVKCWKNYRLCKLIYFYRLKYFFSEKKL